MNLDVDVIRAAFAGSPELSRALREAAALARYVRSGSKDDRDALFAARRAQLSGV